MTADVRGRAGALARTAAFAVLYALAAVLGRMTVLDGGSLSLVWPAAGVAVIWFSAQRRAQHRWADIVALSGVTVAVNVGTGSSWPVACVFVLANLAQVGVFLGLTGRWRPELWGAGGQEPLSSTRQLWVVLGATVVSTATGAAVGSAGLWAATGVHSWLATSVWLARNTASVLVLGAVGLRLGFAVTRRLRRPEGVRSWSRDGTAAWRSTSPWRQAEVIAIALASSAAYLAGFGLGDGLSVAFPLIAVTVLVAVRLSTTFVVVHSVYAGVVVVVFTLQDSGPLSVVGSQGATALVAQLFVVVVAVVGLALSLGRDERHALLVALEAEKERHEHQARLLTTIMDAMADGVSVVDPDGRVVMRNAAAARLFGGRSSPGDVVTGAGHYGLFHPDGTLVADEDLPFRRVRGAGRETADYVVRNDGVPDGRVLEVTTTALTGTRGTGPAVLVFHDVTAERRHRDELTNFAGVVAHDLLNPLTTVEGWTAVSAALLREAPGDPALVAALDGLGRVERAGARMRGLISDLLAYTTAGEATVASTHVDLGALVEDIAAARADAESAAGDDVPRIVAAGPLPMLFADAVLVRQLLDNLIGNAVKYTAAEVTPDVRVSARTLGEGFVEVHVDDNGIGIPDGQHAAVFGNFHRAHRNMGYGGTGLGLAICKRIVERHGGRIAASPLASGGTRITFTLPAVAADAEPVLHIPAPRVASTRPAAVDVDGGTRMPTQQ